MNTSRPLLSIVVPAHNEAASIASTIRNLEETLQLAHVPHEFIVIDDHSSDTTSIVVRRLRKTISSIRFVSSVRAPGFGNALKMGVAYAVGIYIVFVMADGSETPSDIVRMYETARRTHADCVFGNRFLKQTRVEGYPFVKRIFNRVGNFIIRRLFNIPYRDLTNACKLYTKDCLQRIGPFVSPSFSLSMEIALSAVIRRQHVVEVPIDWKERVNGKSKFDLCRNFSAYATVIYLKRHNISREVHSYLNGGLLMASFAYAAWRMFYFILHFTWPIPVLDHWKIARYFLYKTPLVSVLLSTQNEHHIGVGAVINIVLVYLSHWNTVYETMFIGILLLATAFFAVALKKRIIGHIEVFDGLIPLLFLNLYQSENLLWGFQIAFVLPLFFLFFFAYIRLARQSWLRDCLLVLIALLSAYSSFHGLLVSVLVYGSFLYDMFRTKSVTRKIRYAALIGFVALICCSYVWTMPDWYAFDLTFLGAARSFSFSLLMQDFGLYVSSLLGVQTAGPIILVVPFLLICSLWYLIRRYRGVEKTANSLSLYALCFYSVLFFVFIWFARSNSGSDINALMSSRYTTHVIPLYFFIYTSLQLKAQQSVHYRYVSMVIVTFFIVSNIISASNAVNERTILPSLRAWVSCYRHYENIERCDAETSFSLGQEFARSDAYQLLHMLKERRWNLYRQ